MEYMEYILAFYLTFFLASILEILYGIFSGIHSDILFVMCLGPGVAHCIRSSPHGSDLFMSTVPTNWQKENTEEE